MVALQEDADPALVVLDALVVLPDVLAVETDALAVLLDVLVAPEDHPALNVDAQSADLVPEAPVVALLAPLAQSVAHPVLLPVVPTVKIL